MFHHSGIKIPFFAFFSHDSGKRPKEAPWNMLLAMGIAAAFCVGLGVGYPWLYKLLPWQAGYEPYTWPHVVTQLQLLLFAALAFVVLMLSGLYPAELRKINLDTDGIYRRLLPRIVGRIGQRIRQVDAFVRQAVLRGLKALLEYLGDRFSERGILGGTWTTGVMAVWATILLCLCLLLNYL